MAQFTAGLLSELGAHDLALALLGPMLALGARRRLVTLTTFERLRRSSALATPALAGRLVLLVPVVGLSPAAGLRSVLRVRLATLLALRLPASLLSPLVAGLLAGVCAARLALPAALLVADRSRRPLGLLAALVALRMAGLLAVLTRSLLAVLPGRLPLLAPLAVALLAERLARRLVTLGLAARLLSGPPLLALLGAHPGLLAPARLPRLVRRSSMLLAVRPLVLSGPRVTLSLSTSRAISLLVRIAL